MAATDLSSNHEQPNWATAILLLADGTIFWGKGAGAQTVRRGEVCFNTSITGYQEILTDPSYAGQIITFTFPHIGNVGTNSEDIENDTPWARGCILAADITNPSNWRSGKPLNEWLCDRGIPCITGVDTRQLTSLIRTRGAVTGSLAYFGTGVVDLAELHAKTIAWPGLEGMDLAAEVTTTQSYIWREPRWRTDRSEVPAPGAGRKGQFEPLKVAALDFGIKRNILRSLATLGCDVVVVPADISAREVQSMRPDGILLSNGPGDPKATGRYAVPTIRHLLTLDIPIFGICLGHQLLARALGLRTEKMHHGHRGANHPVKNVDTDRVEITSQNHGFVVEADALPAEVRVTHVSLFDGTLEGLSLVDRPVFSVQFHPEASPGPEDTHYLFGRFVTLMEEARLQKRGAPGHGPRTEVSRAKIDRAATAEHRPTHAKTN